MAYKLYYNNRLIKKIYKGSQEIKKVYKGSQLIWQADPYEPGSTLIKHIGAYTWEQSLPEGVYDLVIAGGGGNGGRYPYSGVWVFSNGGSGAAWEGRFYNPKQQTIKLYAAANQEAGGASYMELGGVRMITCNNGHDNNALFGQGGAGGTIEVSSSLQVRETRVSANGNKGADAFYSNPQPTAAVCTVDNWGRGGCYGQDPIAGGFQLKYVTMD